ncbi:hypothetical protein JCM33374_g4850 [Metschnikowia sp. JCM 33374]|nr:hypothetical protein JCM33374_g4850 [Metschnikowia sp. JCM 33374]
MHDEIPDGTQAKQPGSTLDSAEYGRLECRNIDTVVFGESKFATWYGNSAYFLSHGDDKLGIDQGSGGRRRGFSPAKSGFWLDVLYVCECCFKYTAKVDQMAAHRSVCSLNKRFPPLGQLVYADTKRPFIIKKVRGFRHPLFCQNLALFGKLFLDDKSVFYNVEAFDFYVVYGYGHYHGHDPSMMKLSPLRPMGFFTKEVNSWESDNNLACICIFPPFQRLGLGSLLIEFSYALASVTPGQSRSGPEFPLSPYGKVLYLRFWARRLAFVILNEVAHNERLTLSLLADTTGFRKEDILMTLEYMGVLCRASSEKSDITLSIPNTEAWCEKNGVNTKVLGTMLEHDYLLI